MGQASSLPDSFWRWLLTGADPDSADALDSERKADRHQFMGTTLLIGSCEPFSGKSALVLGIAQQLIQSGLPIRFGKPLATSLEWDPDQDRFHSP